MRQAGVIGVRVGRCWGTPAVVLCKLLFISVTLCLLSYHLPPSLTVPCQSASCRFLIKENISLMSPSTSNPLSHSLSLLLHLLLSALSYLLPSRVRQPGSLPSACLWNLRTEPWYAPGVLKLNALPFFFFFFSSSPLGFENCCLEHYFPTKQVEGYDGCVITPGLSLLCCVKDKRRRNQLYFLLAFIYSSSVIL